MQRYENFAEEIRTQEGTRRYGTLYYPTAQRSQFDTFIITKRYDRLDQIAFTFYGDPRMWIFIAKANNFNKPTIYVPPGTRVRIPVLQGIAELTQQFEQKQL